MDRPLTSARLVITPGREEVEAHIDRFCEEELRDGEENTMRDRHGEALQDFQLAPRPPCKILKNE